MSSDLGFSDHDLVLTASYRAHVFSLMLFQDLNALQLRIKLTVSLT